MKRTGISMALALVAGGLGWSGNANAAAGFAAGYAAGFPAGFQDRKSVV